MSAAARFTAEFALRECWRWKWHGHEIAKNPMDLGVYQEIIWETRPNAIIECGTHGGGSALFLAEQLDLIGEGGFVMTIDIADRPGRPSHHRIRYCLGSSADPALYRAAQEACCSPTRRVLEPRVMVILDSDHRREHVAAELALWSPLVTPGQYLIVEDTCINGHPALPDWGPGPFEATQAFLVEHPEFEVDFAREKFLSTFNPAGYLRRK